MTGGQVELCILDSRTIQHVAGKKGGADEVDLEFTEAQRETMQVMIGQSIQFYDRIGATEPWTGYLTVDTRTRQVLGQCGFKGNPDSGGMVEIAYFTFQEFEGKGYATAAARLLGEIAAKDSVVKKIWAHTLATENASCQILRKLGFQKLGEIIDPEDGKIWRWEKCLTRE